MRIEETREVTVVQKVVTGRVCDVCGAAIVPDAKANGAYNYFKVTTHHYDWGNDSVDSLERFDLCGPGCVMAFTEKYVQGAYDEPVNTKAIEIEHVRTLQSGA